MKHTHLYSTLVVLLTSVNVLGQGDNRPFCTISPAPRDCQIRPNQVCPGGCIKSARCSTSTTTTTTVTRTASASTSTVTITATASGEPAPACATEIPYVNVYSFPDAMCSNQTTTLFGLQKTCNGLQAPPTKLNTLTFDAGENANATCKQLGTRDSQSLYYSFDGLPGRPAASCFIEFYTSTDCSGIFEDTLGPGLANECLQIPGLNSVKLVC